MDVLYRKIVELRALNGRSKLESWRVHFEADECYFRSGSFQGLETERILFLNPGKFCQYILTAVVQLVGYMFVEKVPRLCYRFMTFSFLIRNLSTQINFHQAFLDAPTFQCPPGSAPGSDFNTVFCILVRSPAFPPPKPFCPSDSRNHFGMNLFEQPSQSELFLFYFYVPFGVLHSNKQKKNRERWKVRSKSERQSPKMSQLGIVECIFIPCILVHLRWGWLKIPQRINVYTIPQQSLSHACNSERWAVPESVWAEWETQVINLLPFRP